MDGPNVIDICGMVYRKKNWSFYRYYSSLLFKEYTVGYKCKNSAKIIMCIFLEKSLINSDKQKIVAKPEIAFFLDLLLLSNIE